MNAAGRAYCDMPVDSRWRRGVWWTCGDRLVEHVKEGEERLWVCSRGHWYDHTGRLVGIGDPVISSRFLLGVAALIATAVVLIVVLVWNVVTP